MYNINFPSCAVSLCKGIRITRQSVAVFDDYYRPVKHPDHGKIFWLAGEKEETDSSSEFDSEALREGYLTVTPLDFDLTSEETLSDLASLEETDLRGRADWREDDRRPVPRPEAAGKG